MLETLLIESSRKRNIPAFGSFGNSVTFKVKNSITAKKLRFLKKRKIIINYKYKNLLKIF